MFGCTCREPQIALGSPNTASGGPKSTAPNRQLLPGKRGGSKFLVGSRRKREFANEPIPNAPKKKYAVRAHPSLRLFILVDSMFSQTRWRTCAASQLDCLFRSTGVSFSQALGVHPDGTLMSPFCYPKAAARHPPKMRWPKLPKAALEFRSGTYVRWAKTQRVNDTCDSETQYQIEPPAGMQPLLHAFVPQSAGA